MFISEQHPGSRRTAVIEDDGTTGFLYLTEPGGLKLAGDCWLFNRIPAPDPSAIQNHRGSAPPAPQGYAGPDAQQATPSEDAVSVLWSSDGNAACVLIEGQPIGFLVAGEAGHGGSSRHLIRSGPWGKPWDEQRYRAVFGLPSPGPDRE